MDQVAQVVVLSGNAVIVGLDGTTRPLRPGDAIATGELLRTLAGASVELLLNDGQVLHLAPDQELRLDDSLAQTESTPTAQDAALQLQTPEAVLQVLQQGGNLEQALEATAAGAGTGDGGDGSSFVRLLRIVEGVEPLSYEYGVSGLPQIEDVELGSVTTIEDGQPVALTLSGTTSVGEGDTASYAIRLDGVLGVGQSVTMTLDSVSGTATEAIDFARLVAGALMAGSGLTLSGVSTDATTGAVTFTVTNSSGSDIAAGATLVSVSLGTVDDPWVEGSESFTLTLSSVVTVSGSPVTTTINDDDVPLASISVSPATVAEDGGVSLIYSVTLDRAPVVDTVIHLAWGGTATAGSDFSGAQPATVTVLAGQTTGSQTVTITPTADAIDELDETVTATITPGSGYGIDAGSGSATGTILDDDMPVDDVPVASISVSPATVAEDGGVSLIYTVTLDRAPVVDTVVHLAWSGTATAGSDFSGAQPATVTVLAGQTTGSQTVTITPTADAIDELDETVTATITPGSGYGIDAGSGSAAGTILDDDMPVDDVPVASISVSPATVAEDGTISLIYTVTLDRAPVVDTVVHLAWSGTATAGSDFSGAQPATVTVLAGQTTGSQTVTITPTADAIDELDETVTATITPGSGYGISAGSGSAAGTLLDDDVPTIQVGGFIGEDGVLPDNILVSEGDDAVFVVQLTGVAEDGTLTLNLDPSGAHPATEGLDYEQALPSHFQYSLDAGVSWQDATEGSPFHVNPGASQLLVRSDTFNDSVDEFDETFTLTGRLGSLGQDYSDSATATILDNDIPVVSLLGGASGVEGYAARFTIGLSLDPVSPVNVMLTLGKSGDTASSGTDYTGTAVYQADGTLLTTVSAGGSFTLAGLTGDTEFYVRTTDDALHENNEQLTVAITSSSAGTAVSATNRQAVATIEDNDYRSTIVADDGLSAGNDRVYEAGLPTGSDALKTVLAEGTITVGDLNGLADIRSLTFTPAGGTALNLHVGVGVDTPTDKYFDSLAAMQGQGFATANGQVTLANYSQTDSQSGVFVYRYQLTQATKDASNASDTEIFDRFNVSVSDAEGASAPAVTTITIIDDTPTVSQTFNPNLTTSVAETGGGDWLGQFTTAIPGGLSSLPVYDYRYGADGTGVPYQPVAGSPSLSQGRLSFSYNDVPPSGLATTLSSVAGGAISLFIDAADITQKTLVGRDSDGGSDVFRIRVVNDQLETTLYEAVADPLQNDPSGMAKLTLSSGSGVRLLNSVKVTDADGDIVLSDTGPVLSSGSDSYISFVNHARVGTPDSDALSGGHGDDLLIGGPGDDSLTGDLGADVFRWELADAGTGTPAIDHLVDFTPDQGDAIDLRDLLQDEHATLDGTWNLDQYLNFGDEGGQLALQIDPDGAGPGGVTQKIVFDNLADQEALSLALTGGGGLHDADLIRKLVEQGNLKLDP